MHEFDQVIAAKIRFLKSCMAKKEAPGVALLIFSAVQNVFLHSCYVGRSEFPSCEATLLTLLCLSTLR